MYRIKRFSKAFDDFKKKYPRGLPVSCQTSSGALHDGRVEAETEEEYMEKARKFKEECEEYEKKSKTFSSTSYPFPFSSKINESGLGPKQKAILQKVDWDKIVSAIYEYEGDYAKNSFRDFKEGLVVYGIATYRDGSPYLHIECKDSSNLLKNYSKMSYWEVDLSDSGYPEDVVFGD